MRLLIKRMLREIRFNKGKFISIVLILGIGSFVFSGLLSSIKAIDSHTEQYYKEQNTADIYVYYAPMSNINKDFTDRLILNENISEAEIRYQLNVEIGGSDSKILSFGNINKPYLTDGKLPAGTEECLIDQAYATHNNIKVNDTVSFNYKNTNKKLTVSGICISPDSASKSKNVYGGMVNDSTFALIYADIDLMLQLEPLITYGATEVLITSTNEQNAKEFIDSDANVINSFCKENTYSYSMVANALDPVRNVINIIPYIFYFVAAIITFICMTKTVENDRTQTAVMQSVGYSKTTIALSYLFYGFLASVFGAVIFSVIGNFTLPYILSDTLMSRFYLPKITIPFYPLYMLGGFLIGLFFSGFAILLTLIRVLKEVPAQAMRPRPPKNSHRIIFEKIPSFWNKLKYSSKLNLRNICTGKRRLLFTSVGVIGGVMLLLFDFLLNDAVDGCISPITNSYKYDFSVSFITDVDENSFSNLGYKTENIEKSKTFDAYFDPDMQDSFYLIFIENGTKSFSVQNSGKKINIDENTVIINKVIHDKYNLDVGDDLSFYYNNEMYTVKISDISDESLYMRVYLSTDYATEFDFPMDKPTYLFTMNNQNDIEPIVNEIKNNYNVSNVEFTKDIIKSANKYKTVNCPRLCRQYKKAPLW